MLNLSLVFPVLEAYFSLVLFSFLLLGSPGPAPLAIAATGAVFGIRKGLDFLLGILLGFFFVLFVQGLALVYLLGKNLVLMQVLQVFGFLYVLYIAYKITTVPTTQIEESPFSPPSFFDGFILNLTNPKAYAAMAIIYSQMLIPYESQNLAYILTGLISFLVVVAVDLMWLFLGKLIQPYIQDPIIGRKVRLLFALMMVGMVMLAMVKNFKL